MRVTHESSLALRMVGWRDGWFKGKRRFPGSLHFLMFLRCVVQKWRYRHSLPPYPTLGLAAQRGMMKTQLQLRGCIKHPWMWWGWRDPRRWMNSYMHQMVQRKRKEAQIRDKFGTFHLTLENHLAHDFLLSCVSFVLNCMNREGCEWVR